MREILHPDTISAVSCTIIMTLLDRPNKTLFRRAILCGEMTQAGKRNKVIFSRKVEKKSVKRFDRSNGLDTALYKNYLYLVEDL